MSKYKELQTKIAIITESKVTDFFCMADDFCKFYDAMVEKYTLPRRAKHKYHCKSTLSKAEVMMILILFHDSGYPQTFLFYLDEVCKYLRYLFPKVVSYNRFVELEKEIAIPLALFIKKVLMVKMLTEHESNMRKILRRNEGIWFSDFWMKVLVIFLFVYTMVLGLVTYCVI